jgi:hypothetical protein
VSVVLLEYRPTVRRRWPWRLLIGSICLAVLAPLVVSYGVAAGKRVVLLVGLHIQRRALFRQCLTHAYSSRTVVFDEGLDTKPVRYPDESLPAPQGAIPPRGTKPRRPADPMDHYAGFAHYRWPHPRNSLSLSAFSVLDALDQEWRGRIRCASGMASIRSPSLRHLGADEVFVHGRRAAANTSERLVAIGFDPMAFMAGNDKPFRAEVVAQPTALRELDRTCSLDAFGFHFDCPPSQRLRLLAGQADPSDESHFTIPYETPAGAGTIEGWLRPDDTVRLKVTTGPLS